VNKNFFPSFLLHKSTSRYVVVDQTVYP